MGEPPGPDLRAWLSHVVRPDASPPITDPANAESAEIYATSIPR